MNKKERSQITRLYKLMNSIPLPLDGGGSKTASFAGYISYANDMREVAGVYGQIILAITAGDKMQKEFGEPTADMFLDALELWIKERQKQKWEAQSLPVRFQHFLNTVRENQAITP